MKRWKIGIIGVLLGVLLTGFASVAMAASDGNAWVIKKLQGPWYDTSGNEILNFEGNTVSGCQILGVYNAMGGGEDFSCTIRVKEHGGYRDIPIVCEKVGRTNYNHSHIRLNGDNWDPGKGTLLIRTKRPQFTETVGGIGIDMPSKEVVSKLGKPDTITSIRHRIAEIGTQKWSYKKLGLELEMRNDAVWKIRILKKSKLHFDSSGLNCKNQLYEFQSKYELAQGKRLFVVGKGEFIWFDNYPDSMELNTDAY